MKVLKAILPLVAPGIIVNALISSAQDAWVPDGPPAWSNTALQTTGGITFFTHGSEVLDCDRIASGPVLRNGTNLTQVINHEVWTGVCVADRWYHHEDHVSVLGTLPPGNYVLRVLSWDSLSQSNKLFAQLPFSVAALSGPTLTLLLDTNGLTFRLAVAGIPNAHYLIETSPTLTNWTAIATNNGGPFVLSVPFSPQVTNRFYRASVFGN